MVCPGAGLEFGDDAVHGPPHHTFDLHRTVDRDLTET
jgi:hypothetical protein